jgi:hypothetical protein
VLRASGLGRSDAQPKTALIHRVLDSVRYAVEIPDRFGKPVRPREWFMVPLPIINEIVERIADGTLAAMKYDRQEAALVRE